MLWKFRLALLALTVASCGVWGCESDNLPYIDLDNVRTDVTIPVPGWQLLPRSDMTGAFKVMSGTDKGQMRPFSWTVKNSKWTFVEKGNHRWFYHEDDFRIILDREDDLSENVQVNYEPGIVIFPTMVSEGGMLPKGKVKMVVRDLNTGKIRDQGSCTYEMTGVLQKPLTTPLGTFKGYLVEQKRHLDLNLAKVDLTVHTGYVPGKGMVIDELWQTVHSLGLITTHGHQLVERVR